MTTKTIGRTDGNCSVMPPDERSFSGRARHTLVLPTIEPPARPAHPAARRLLTKSHLGSISLWVSTRASTSDPWSAPAYLGPVINDPGYNAGAALSFDGTAIYFQASKISHPEFDNYALFVATRTKTKAEEK